MTANLDTTLGFAALAFTGARSKIWHREGQSVDQKVNELGRPLTSEEWLSLSGLNFEVQKVPLVVDLNGERFDHIEPAKRMLAYPDRFANIRTDTGAPLGIVSDQYQIVQPRAVAGWFEQFISVDDRFHLTTMGALDGGRRIWAQAEFNGEQTIAGDVHRAKLLMSTTFDATGCTNLQGCTERVVCQNTLRVAMSENAPNINVRHTTKFDAARATKDLAKIANGFAKYKEVGDALAQTMLAKQQVDSLIRCVLNIPADAKPQDISTRKHNQRQAIIDALQVTANERGFSARADNIDAFSALQAITRYVDHDRNSDDTESRLFGSGAKLKDRALAFVIDPPKGLRHRRVNRSEAPGTLCRASRCDFASNSMGKEARHNG